MPSTIFLVLTNFREHFSAPTFILAALLCRYLSLDDFRVEAANWILFDLTGDLSSADESNSTGAPRNVGQHCRQFNTEFQSLGTARAGGAKVHQKI